MPIKAALIANSILLSFITVLLANKIFTGLNFGSMAKRALEAATAGFKSTRRGSGEVKRYTRAVPVKMSFAERLSVVFIDRSNIRRYLPFFDSRVLISLCVVSLLLIIGATAGRIGFLPSAIIISLLFALWPFALLDIMGRYNSARIRRKLSNFISILGRWCAVKEDIFYAFEKTLTSGIEEPLNSFVRDMVIQVKRGIEPEKALEMLQLKVANSQFADFIINIKQCIRSRGDIRKLLGNLEDQFYKIEEEYNRRKISTHKDRIVIYVVMVAVLVLAWFLLSFNPQVSDFYINTNIGRLMLGGFSLLYAGGVYFTLSLDSYKY